jgi:tRNA 2-thiouridine synthesizing protein A
MAQDYKEITLDLSGLLCPLPVLKARKRLQSMAAHDVLRVIVTDPMAAIDVPHFCNEQGHLLLAQDKIGSALHFRIKKAP